MKILKVIVTTNACVFVSFLGDPLEPDRFAGVYLPLMWDPKFCVKVPLAMTFTFQPGVRTPRVSMLMCATVSCRNAPGHDVHDLTRGMRYGESQDSP
jgi:hypothetical protein